MCARRHQPGPDTAATFTTFIPSVGRTHPLSRITSRANEASS
jgi:hypothetical protein